MRLLDAIFGARAVDVDAATEAAIARWRALSPADLRAPLPTQRWRVVDVETTGLDMRRDRLLAIGAVAMEGNEIRLQDSFEIVLKQAKPSTTGNILIHRIGGSEQCDGIEPRAALLAFLAYAEKFPCVAFHAQFDETMLKRAFDENLGLAFSPLFIDLALLAPALCSDAPPGLRSLDDWVDYFSIAIPARHRAVADAFGTAQLFQVLLRRAVKQNIGSAEALFKIAQDQRWLARIRPH